MSTRSIPQSIGSGNTVLSDVSMRLSALIQTRTTSVAVSAAKELGGIGSSRIISAIRHGFHRINDLVYVRECERFEVGGVGQRRVDLVDAGWGCVEVVEGFA